MFGAAGAATLAGACAPTDGVGTNPYSKGSYTANQPGYRCRGGAMRSSF